jgi:predicted transcriptional regulator
LSNCKASIDVCQQKDSGDLAVQSGAYRNSAEVLDRAFEIIREQLDLEDWMSQREAIATHIETGFAQAERGELIDGGAAMAMLRQRRAEHLTSLGRTPAFN